MGKEESKVPKKAKSIRNTKIQRAVLKAVAVTGFLAVAVLAPNALQMLKGPLGLGKKKESHSSSITNATK